MPTLTRRFGAAALALSITAGAALSASQLAGRPADDWSARLERPERIAGLKIDYIIASLGLKPGLAVADIGAGPGVLSIPIAKAVGPNGKVYAVEIDKDYFPHITQKAAAERVANVVTVLGAFTDPKIPARDVDVALFHDVLHHIDDRAGYLKATAKYVKPDGRIAVVELPPSGSHKDEPALIVTKDQVKSWMSDAGFRPVQEFNGLNEGKWFVVYARK
ncbi:MAG TPA: class I SAM-dependent methyltransferase [Vicinamibacterales bacterium]